MESGGQVLYLKKTPAWGMPEGTFSSFRYIDSTIPLFCGCTDQFVTDLAGNPKDRRGSYYVCVISGRVWRVKQNCMRRYLVEVKSQVGNLSF